MGFVGSPRYMSPGQVQEDAITNQTDFSLRIVTYGLFSVHHPFGDESFSSPIHKVIYEDPFPMKMFRSSLPRVLERPASKVLEKSTEWRSRSGLDFALQISTLFSNLDLPQADVFVKENSTA